MKEYQPGQMVEVEWLDPGGINGWHGSEQWESGWEHVLEPAHSIGYLVEDSERGVAIVSGYARHGTQHMDSTIIPRINVVKVTRLRRGG